MPEEKNGKVIKQNKGNYHAGIEMKKKERGPCLINIWFYFSIYIIFTKMSFQEEKTLDEILEAPDISMPELF